MKLSAEEKMMYKVMKALYDCGIPVNFKGSMVLKACLMEAGFTEDTRHTVDIDGNWYSETAPTGDQIIENAVDYEKLKLEWEKDPVLYWQKVAIREYVPLKTIDATSGVYSSCR